LTTQKKEPPVQTEIQTQAKDDGLTTPEKTKNKRIPVPDHVEPSSRKEAFGAVFLDPMINHDC
jgi:hypothetical protein